MEGISSIQRMIFPTLQVRAEVEFLSINLTHIIRLPGVCGRVGEAIFISTTMLIGSLIALVPDLDRFSWA
jgi:hypothetical protein